MRSRDLTGKVVAITGGGGGIGRALAEAFVGAGGRVALLDLDAAAAASVASDLGADVAVSIRCDITDPAQCEAAIAAVEARWGGVDVLVNNAGISHHSLFADTDPSVLRKVMEVNFFGAANCTRAALPSIVRRRGVIVAISSVAGFAPLIGRTGYAASKHAMHGLFDSLRTELAGTGADVLIVCPSFVDTGMDTRALAGDGSAMSGGKSVIGRLLTPQEVAAAVVDGVTRRSKRRLVSPVAKVSWWLSKLLPDAYARLMRRNQASTYEDRP